jgi:hypothetical protein
MLLQCLISTTYNRYLNATSLAEDIFRNCGITSVICCQTFDAPTNIHPESFSTEAYSLHFSDTKGLSISRNILLSLSKGHFSWILDDDVSPCFTGIRNLLSFLEANLDIAALSCKFTDVDGVSRKNYKNHMFEHGIFSVMKVSSIELILNSRFLCESSITFDENFGLGAKYPSGEENILLSDIVRKRGLIKFYPEVICFHPLVTSASVKFDQKSWKARGALMRRVFGAFGLLFFVPFFLRRVRAGQTSFSNIFSAISNMVTGFFYR